ncbi:MAG TPA: MBL fold metallo-hydrolase [Ohtaekwangia sp.]|uniref:MBL fold metallo-hydrolase n=1 Tax=Ohtaekwangia sp. TaxID=2066019 RepID=UPI002F955C98
MNPIIDETEDILPVATRVWGRKEVFVNFYMIQDEASGNWALVDAGLKWSAPKIIRMAEELFHDRAPSAIVLTHGHFDHVGALPSLLKKWNVPVYAHELELPYLTGISEYPPADPSVGGGMMSAISFMYPRGPIDISSNIQKLPNDGTIPGFPEWRYIETPGHSPGHISLFRESDRVLLAGDAFVTTKAESAFYALTFKEYLSGPPKYFTCNWASAKMSVLKLLGLHPEIIATGHGKPMQGSEMRAQLEQLAIHFDELAQPAHGRYIQEPAVTNRYGLATVPARSGIHPAIKMVAAAVLVFSSAYILYSRIRASQ